MGEQIDLGALRMRYSGERLCSCGSRVVRCDGDSYNLGRCSGCGEEHFMHGVPYRDRDVLALINEVERLRTTEVPGLSPEEVATNIARGVPAFWAPWVMWTVPTVKAPQVAVYVMRSALIPLQSWKEGKGIRSADAPGGWMAPGSASAEPFIALGPEGPTLKCWLQGGAIVG